MPLRSVRAAVLLLVPFWLLILLSATAGAADGSWKNSLQRKTISDDGGSLDYRLLVPEALAAGGEAKKQYPLVLFLHGAGERGSDNEAQLVHGIADFYQRRESYPAFVVVPQCPEEKQWVEVPWTEATGTNTFPEHISEPLRLAIKIVDQLIASGDVDRERVYVTGLSMGGFGTWYPAGIEGHPFAAAVPVCGGGDPSWAERYVDLPLWVFHGDADTTVPVERSREMVEAIREAGGDPKYTEYPGVRHNSWAETYRSDALYEWLFQQRRRGAGL